MPSPEEMKAAVARDIKRLEGLQNPDGGFAFWRRGDPSWPYVSIHVAHALTRAKEKGYDVPPSMLDRSKSYLRAIESHIPRRYGRDARNTLIAYALYTRARMNDRDAERARRLIATEGLEKLQLEAVGWLLPVLSGDRASGAEVAAIRRLLRTAPRRRRDGALPTSYADDDTCCCAPTVAPTASSSKRSSATGPRATSSRRSRAACSHTASRGAGRTRRRTPSSSSRSTATSARTRRRPRTSSRARGSATPTRASSSSAGARPTGSSSTCRCATSPRRGAGLRTSSCRRRARASYYRVGLSYAPTNLKLRRPLRFAVERVYEAVDDPADVRRDADGTWRVRPGRRCGEADAGRPGASLSRRAG